MNDKAPPTARQAGLARHLTLDHNPVRRHVDRLETCITAGLSRRARLAGRLEDSVKPVVAPQSSHEPEHSRKISTGVAWGTAAKAPRVATLL